MRAVFSFTLLVIVLAGCSKSGLSGVVSDADGSPLAGIFISVRDTASRMTTTVVTDENGSFSLPGITRTAVEVRMHQVGYTTRIDTIPAGARTILEVTLLAASDIVSQLPSSSFTALLPEGEEKRFLATACLGCHQFNQRFIEKDGRRMTKEEWKASFTKMLTFFGPKTGFPIIPPIPAVDRFASFMATHLSAGITHASENVPSPIEGKAADVVITEYDMPQPFELPHDLIVDAEGNVVITGMFSHTMMRLDPATGSIETFPIPVQGAGPRALEIDAAGSWWVLLGNPRLMGRFHPDEGTWKTYPIEEYPHSVGLDAKGNIWFNAHFSKDPERIAKLDTATGAITWYEVPSAGMTDVQGGPIPYELRVGSDGVVWGGELHGNRIFRLDPETGQFKVYTMPTTHSGPRRFDIAPDGMLWIPEYGGNNLTRFDPVSETFRQYPYPTSSALPYVVRVNRQTGDVWIATAAADEVARFDPRSETFTVYRMPTQVALMRHMDIDPRTGDVWVAYGVVPSMHPKVARVTMRK